MNLNDTLRGVRCASAEQFQSEIALMEQLERIPKTGDVIEMCGNKFIVSRMEGNRIRRIRVEEPPQEAEQQ